MKKGAFNLLKLRGFLRNSIERKSVETTAHELIGFLNKLSKIDSVFGEFELNKVKKPISIGDLGIVDAKKELIKQIVESTDWWNGVPSEDKTRSPTEKSSLSTGFRLSLNFKENGKKRFSITGNTSIETKHGLHRNLFIEYFNTNTDKLYPFTWYEEVLKAYVNYWDPSEASIIYQSSELLKMGVKTGIGRLSYFSNDFEVPVPKDLKNVKYVPTENGNYIYVCTDIIPEKEAFLACEAKTVTVMNEWLERVPEYKKEKRS